MPTQSLHSNKSILYFSTIYYSFHDLKILSCHLLSNYCVFTSVRWFTAVTTVNPQNILIYCNYYSCHFTDEGMLAQKDDIICQYMANQDSKGHSFYATPRTQNTRKRGTHFSKKGRKRLCSHLVNSFLFF